MNFGSGGGGGGGLFGVYNQIMGYKNLKNQEYSQREGLRNQLNQANNNLMITQEQAPLVPQQAEESFAARGVGQSTFGNGMGDQWAATPPPTTSYVDPHTGAPAPAGGAGQYVKPVGVTPPATSGQGQPVGTGLQRARDLSAAMVSNAQSGQKAAQVALDNYNRTIKNNRHMFYAQQAENWIGMIAGLML